MESSTLFTDELFGWPKELSQFEMVLLSTNTVYVLVDIHVYESILFVGHQETVQTLIRRRRMRCLIMESTVCSQKVYQNLDENEIWHPTILKAEMD